MRKGMKLFAGYLKVNNGEYEHNHPIIVCARNIASAEKEAHKYASRFYGDRPDKDGGCYYFNGGEVSVRVDMLTETTKEEWMQKAFNRSLI